MRSSTAWQQCGDKGIVRDKWPAMQKWMEFTQGANHGLLRSNKTGANFADWLDAGGCAVETGSGT